MKQPVSTIINIAQQTQQSGLSKGQKLFNKLIKKIEAERQQLVVWQNLVSAYQDQYTSQFQPLWQSFNGCRAELVRLFDNAYSAKGLSKSDKEKISDIVCNIAEEIISEGNYEDLKKIYNQHSQSDFDAEIEEQHQSMKSMMEDALEMEMGDVDFDSPEAMTAHIREKMQQQFLEQERLQDERDAHSRQRKKSAKTLGQEALQQKEQQNVSQSVREVYRKLVSALHPDREPDETERERKTTLMKRVNIAYDKKDLLALLELQLEIEQIDQAKINNLGEDRLKYYNQVLTDQFAELQAELAAVQFGFKMRFNLDPTASASPTQVMRGLKDDVQGMQRNIKSLKADLLAFRDIKNIKAWLKTYRIPVAPLFDDRIFGEINFEELFGAR